ncbi:GNAT family N-acetyltransferase [Neobacillus jeddahensis]|uniref:GNAT family N-acetyltransferase n=1 Tax=Neobacillus jeddahensis TaxID=1461580 RepID=UPI00058DA757|nr:GNAT family N-acetyltransferase [Neobacillus jeddahensis]
MNFRTMDPDKDREWLITCRKDAFVESFGTDEGFGAEQTYINRISDMVKQFPKGHVIVEENDVAIGQMEMQIREFEGTEIGYVNLFYLIPAYRSKGLGKELVSYAEGFFRGFHVSEYHLRVSPTNERALQLYRKIGMVKVREEHDRYLVYRMRKLL